MTLARSLATVFEQLATPQKLGDWLPEMAAVKGDAAELGEIGTGTVFGLRLRKDGQEIAGTGEVIAHEPPWSVAYRLVTASQTYVLRLTCVSVDGATRVSVHQADTTPPLAVDLNPLAGLDPEDS